MFMLILNIAHYNSQYIQTKCIILVLNNGNWKKTQKAITATIFIFSLN